MTAPPSGDIPGEPTASSCAALGEALGDAFFDQAAAGLWLASAEGRYVRVNPAFARLLGHDSPEEMRRAVLRIPAQVYADPADWEAGLAVLSGAPALTRDACCYGRDGQMVWLRESLFAVRRGPDQPLLLGGVARDVSRSVIEDSDRQALVDMLRQVMDTITDAMVLSDLEGRVVFCNSVFAARFRLRPEDAEGRDLAEWLEALDPSDADHLARLAACPEPYNLILRERAGGDLRFCTVSPFADAGGGILGAILMLRDDRLRPNGSGA